MRVIAVTQTADGTALTVSPATLDFTASGETKSVTVTSDVSWTVGSDAEWITVTPSLGSNDGVISVTAAANMETSQRTGIVTVNGDGIDQTVSITQAASVSSTNTLTVSPAMLDFTASGETKSVTVTSDVSWTVDGDVEWITITPSSGSNDDVISVTAAANMETGQRTGFVTISGGGIEQTVSITQAASVSSTNTLTVSPAMLDFAASGETKPVTVTSNVNWTVDRDAEWITVTPSSGSNDDAISVTAEANTTAGQRTGFVVVTGGGIMRVITVTQAADGATLTVSPATLDFTASGEIKSVTVTSNVSWTVDRDVEWITITPSSGSNDGVISVAAAANTTIDERTGIVTVTGGGITHTIAVTQAADGTTPPSSPTLTVSAAYVGIAAEGGSLDIMIQSNISWTAVSSEDWVSVSPASGTNDGGISITVAENSTEEARTATVTVAAGDLTRTITVTQKSVGDDDSGNASVGVTDIRYFNNRLYVNTPVAERIAVYSLSGIQMYQSKKQPGIATFDLHSLPRGVLIVRGDSGWVKKIVR
jgi:predicted Kef-type K+ transport protein